MKKQTTVNKVLERFKKEEEIVEEAFLITLRKDGSTDVIGSTLDIGPLLYVSKLLEQFVNKRFIEDVGKGEFVP